MPGWISLPSMGRWMMTLITINIYRHRQIGDDHGAKALVGDQSVVGLVVSQYTRDQTMV